MTPEAMEQATGMARRGHFPTVLPVAKAQQGLRVLRSHSEALAVLPIQRFLPKALPLPRLVVVGEGRQLVGPILFSRLFPGVSGTYWDVCLRGSLGITDTEEHYWFLLFYKGVSLCTCLIYLILTPAYKMQETALHLTYINK